MNELRKSLQEYLATRRSLGFKLVTPARDLHNFLTFMEAVGASYITTPLALCWVRQAIGSLKSKRVTPHVLRHTAAMELLQHGVDRSVIALWLGHETMETTQIYLHADLRLKEQALARTVALTTTPGRYRPSDELLAFLESL